MAPNRPRSLPPVNLPSVSVRRRLRRPMLLLLLLLGLSLPLVINASPAAQALLQPTHRRVDVISDAGTAAEETPPPDGPSTDQPAPPKPAPTDTITLPQATLPPPTLAAPEPGQYVLEFNRSPRVENSLQFDGIYDEKRLRFTRPRNWEPENMQVVLRYRHSPALYATRSNLTVLINGTSVGSIPLNLQRGEIGTATFDVPLHLIQDYNELLVTALQNNSPTCTQDPYDPSLWTEVLPDSKLLFDFQPQAVTPDFSQFPYPLFDVLSLQPNRVAYLLPTATPDDEWLTAAARFQATLGRIADYRPLETRLVQAITDVTPDERLVIIGSPGVQPALADLALPLPLQEGQFRDRDGKPLTPDIGVLMWATTAEDQVPVLVASGNGPTGVSKAVQFLVQTEDRQLGVGHVLLVNEVSDPVSPPPRQWPGYLPEATTFQLADLQTSTGEPLQDVTVRGSHSPAVAVDFKALPDDRFLSGGEMTLRYSYGPQINPLTSLVEVELDGVGLEGEQLKSVEGSPSETLKVTLPPDRVTPFSRLQVNFRLDPRERRSCSRVTDQQLWGTVHADTSFTLPREPVVNLPDLRLMRTGFPFTGPQDLAQTAIVLPNQPGTAGLQLMLETVARLGRLSQADSVKLSVYSAGSLTEAVRRDHHLIAIGTQPQFPLPELLQSEGLTLWDQFTRQRGSSQLQALPDQAGVMKAMVSPWNGQRGVLALSGQTVEGLDSLSDLLRHDPLFYQLEGDTALISAQTDDPDPYNGQAYQLEFLRQSPPVEVATTAKTPWLWRLVRANWLLLAPTTIALSLLIYGAAQAYLKQISSQDG